MSDGSEDQVLPLLRLMSQLRGYRCTVVSPDEVELETSGGPQVVSLRNLRMLVAQERPEDRYAFLSRFLNDLADTGEADLGGAAGFEETGKKLRVRLYPEDMEQPVGEVLRRAVAPGMAENVVVDEPTRVVTPARSITDAWPLAPAEIFERGRANVRAAARLELHSLDAPDAPVFAGYLPDYASAHALWLDEYPVLGRHGALVCVPVEGSLYVHPLDGPKLIEAQNMLINLGLSRQDESPRPISADIYHWNAGALHPALAVRPTADRTIEVHVDPTYQPLMESLL
jgi:hypothetical protein